MRKSLISALYGIYMADGKIELARTLGDLGIDDLTPLTQVEKTATVADLLWARSGVYIEAAGEAASMKALRPVRGSHAPGTFWYYNNWDCNALGTIFDQLSGEENIYTAFGKRIAGPIGMPDYDSTELSYAYESYSRHPYYGFRMSTRDLARFGLLFLRNGRWGKQQVVPADWVHKKARSVIPLSPRRAAMATCGGQERAPAESLTWTKVPILMVVGMLIGTWILSGIVPILIDYGLRLLSPGYFLFAACLVCSIVSTATGSSWTTAGTVGVALMGVGDGLGISPAMTAGAIVSGAYFGDKMSPLSDTTNLAPAVADSELFEHVRYMVYTTLPALLLSLAFYVALGWSVQGGSIDGSKVAAIRDVLAQSYELSPILLLAPVLVLVVVALRVPALPGLMGGALLSGVMAFWMQGATLRQILEVAYSGFEAHTGSPQVDEL